jgi:hypothetical protein
MLQMRLFIEEARTRNVENEAWQLKIEARTRQEKCCFEAPRRKTIALTTTSLVNSPSEHSALTRRTQTTYQTVSIRNTVRRLINRDRRKSRQKSAKITANFYINHEKHGKNTEITRYTKTTFLMMKK